MGIRSVVAFVIFAIVASCDILHAENWGHWRGPSGNSVAIDASPPTEWSDTKNVAWKVPLPGRGSGSPIVWGDQVFVVTAVTLDDENGRSEPQRPAGGRRRRGRPEAPKAPLEFQLLCLDRATGAIQWTQTSTVATPQQGTHSTNGFASASPCTDGKHVYAFFGSMGLYCYTMTGDLVWQRKFGQMDVRHSFGEGSSPVLEGDRIIVPWDHEGPSALFALNKLTGDVLWEVARDEPTCWATPLIVDGPHGKQVVMNGQNSARAYHLETGKEIWRCAGQTERPVATPVAADDIVFVGSGHRGAYLGAFRLDGAEDIEDTASVLWSVHKDTPDIASPLLSSGRLYYLKGKTGIITCVEAATGKPHYAAERLPELRMIYASPVAAGGHVFVTGRSGTTVVIKDAEQLEVVAVNHLGETVDATPAPVDDELFIRGENHLFCIRQ